MTPFITVVVTATAGQSESASRKTGFSAKIPFLISDHGLGGRWTRTMG
jgi:hypothetical protein